MIQHIKKIKLLLIILLSITFINCKDNEIEKVEVSNETAAIKSVDSNLLRNKNTIQEVKGEGYAFYTAYFQSGGETDLPEINEDEVVQKFKKIKVVLSTEMISIDGSKSSYKIEQMDTKKFFGKKYLYDYNIDVYKNIFDIKTIEKNIHFISLDPENSDVSPFKDYFLETGIAVFENDFIFLSYKRYFICFKRVNKEKTFDKKYSELPFDYGRLDRTCQFDNRELYSEVCNNEYPVFNFNKNLKLKTILQEKIKDKTLLKYYNIKITLNFEILVVVCEHEEESYGDQYIVSIKDNKVISILDNEKNQFFHSMNFVINKDLTVTFYQNNGIHPKEKINSIYKIKEDGNFLKLK